METFTWKYHTQSTEYPAGYTAALGNSYQYAVEPTSVDQRLFKLGFPVLVYYTQADGVTLDLTKDPATNLGLLEEFYKTHRMWKTFIYPHPVYGNVNARFSSPLKVPPGTVGGNGAVHNLGIELLEQP